MSEQVPCPDCGGEMFAQEACCSGCGCYPELWCPRCKLTREKDLSITREALTIESLAEWAKERGQGLQVELLRNQPETTWFVLIRPQLSHAFGPTFPAAARAAMSAWEEVKNG